MRARSELDVRRAVRTLEDALRCASLPDAGARVLLVRRLNLGPFAADASSQTLSRLIEQKVAALGGTWLHGADAADADAPGAGYVYFRDALEARYLLALRLANAAPCSAWYWPLAVPEFKPALEVHGNLRRIALAIAALPEAPAALPAWIARLSAAGVATQIARTMTPADVVLLLTAAHLPIEKIRAAATATAHTIQAAASPPAPDVAHRAGARPHAADSPLSAMAQASAVPDGAMPAWWQALAIAGGYVARVTSVASAMRDPLAQAAATTSADGIPPRTGPQRGAPPPPPDVTAPTADATPDRVFMPHAATTHYGGLLFMLTLLQRLDFAAWADDLPAGAGARVAREMLALILRRLCAPPDDPAWLLTAAAGDDPAPDTPARAAACWGDPMLAPPRGVQAPDLREMTVQPQPAAVYARLWLSACRRWLRRRAGIGVASLAARPAALSLNATHADVYFPLNATDLRVRRAGLDFDPGWVGWFGRVVSFHYGESVTLTAASPGTAQNHGR